MKKLFLLLALLFACAITQAQMNAFQSASLTTACTSANTTCGGTAGSQLSVGTNGFNVASVTVHGTYTGLTLNFDISDDGGTTWYPDTCTRGDTPTQESSEAVTNSAIRQWDCGVSGTSNFRVRNNAIASGSDVIGITLSVSNIEPAPTVSISGSFTTTLGAGTALIGKVGIDQTTPGTTNAVAVTNLPTTLDTNSGTSGASTLRVAPGTGNFTVVQPTGSNLHAVLDTTSTTAVTQATGTNLHAVLDTTSTTAVTQATGTNLHAVLDTTSTTAVTQTTASNLNATATAAVSTPADGVSNTSVPGYQNFSMIFNGSTWDRFKGITGQTGLLAVGVVNSGTTLGDATSSGIPSTALDNGGNARIIGSASLLFNNSTYDRQRTGATANLPNLIGSTLVANVTVDPCQSSAVAKSSVAINISSATTTSLVAVSGSTTIYVCGFTVTMVGATESIKFVYGTQVTNPCDTGQTALTGAMADGTASDIAVTYGPGSTIFKTIASQQLCAVTTGTVSIQGLLSYVQQ